MVSWLEGLQGAAAVATVVYGYVRLSHKRRAEVRTMAFRWSAYAGTFLIGASSISEIVKFGTSNAALTRVDVLWLLLNIWNGVAYVGFGIAFAALWHRQAQSKKDNDDHVDK